MKAVALFSSGIDSVVAVYLMMKKNVDVVLVHCEMDKKNTEKTIKLAEKLAKLFSKEVRLCIVPFSDLLKRIAKDTKPKYICNICKRMMYRIAEKTGKKEKAEFIITGENLGQVASQTVENLAANKSAINMEIIRPLLSWDKIETIKLAREIGTYDLSTEKSPSCSFVPKHPAIRADLLKIKNEEDKINIDEIADNALKKAKTLNII